MRKENRPSLIALFITVIVAAAVGLYFEALSNLFVAAAPKTEPHVSETKQWVQAEPLLTMPLPHDVQLLLTPPKAPLNEQATPPSVKPTDQPEIKESDLAPHNKAVQVIKSPPAVLTYETTASYLNVRVNAYSKSQIINVVTKGMILEVSSVTENGWLKLKDGGYVHGGYAKQIKNEEKTASPLPKDVKKVKNAREVKTLSVNVAEDALVNEPTSKVESISGLTAQHISLILKGTDLEDQGLEKAILRIEKKYGINAFFTIAVMKLESGNGSSRLAKKKNNLFGLNAIDGDAYNKGLSFKTKADCVLKFGELINKNYIEKGYTTIDKVAKKYCPANSKWSRHVKDIMEKAHDLV